MAILSSWTPAQQDYCYWYCILLIPRAFLDIVFTFVTNTQGSPHIAIKSQNQEIFLILSATFRCWGISSVHIFNSIE